MNIDWSNAPEGATHFQAGSGLFRVDRWFKDDFASVFVPSIGNRWIDCEDDDLGSLADVIERPTSTENPKPLTQAVFDGLPPEYRWAAVGFARLAHAYTDKPFIAKHSYIWSFYIGRGLMMGLEGVYDATDWQNSLIERQDVSGRVEQLRSVEAARQVEKDAVNNPSHYTTGGIECIDAMQAMLSRDEFIGYLRGNIFKYQWRYKLKNGVEDLKKAQWYANRLIELEGGK